MWRMGTNLSIGGKWQVWTGTLDVRTGVLDYEAGGGVAGEEDGAVGGVDEAAGEEGGGPGCGRVDGGEVGLVVGHADRCLGY